MSEQQSLNVTAAFSRNRRSEGDLSAALGCQEEPRFSETNWNRTNLRPPDTTIRAATPGASRMPPGAPWTRCAIPWPSLPGFRTRPIPRGLL
jgi:hypothetical protein